MSAPDGFKFSHSSLLGNGCTVNVYFDRAGSCFMEVLELDEFNVDRETTQYFDKIYMAELGIKA